MILGHFAVALAAKKAAPQTSLGTTILAAQLLDLLWPVFLLIGLERVRIVPGLMAASPLHFEHYPYSHSLLAAVGWGALLGSVYFLLRRSARGAWVVGVLVVSHWFLDAVMHRPDLPLWPGSATRVGAGAWDSVPLTVAIELALFAAGVLVYLRCTRAQDRVGRWALVALIAFLLVVFFGNLAGSAPPSAMIVAWVTLAMWLLVPWGFWIDRHRAERPGPGAWDERSGRSAAGAAGIARV